MDYQKRYYQKNREAILAKMRLRKHTPEELKKITARVLARTKALRDEAVAHYGGECACCGEKRREFLCIDHIDGGGTRHRAEMKAQGQGTIQWWLKRNNYPKGFRVLCFNCNGALGHWGYCPHGGVPPVKRFVRERTKG